MQEVLLSVGIDIGTSTTQVVFSRLTLRNEAGGCMIPRIEIVGKEIIFESALHFTPLLSPTEIDAEAVRKIVVGEYKRACISPEDLSTGAIIITGETARKQNAEEVVRALSGLAGDFVVATAGPDLESILAGRGSGMDQYSREKGVTVANLDVGGGTTNISVFQNGRALDTACFDIGGRLVRFEQDGTMTVQYVAPKIKQLAESIGIIVEEGKPISETDIHRLCERMAQILEEAFGLCPQTPWLQRLCTHHTLSDSSREIDFFSFSGGVADCIYSPERYRTGQFGDIGVELGNALRQSSFFQTQRLIRPKETIRATVVGAGNHSMEVSGSTISYTYDEFPIQDIPVIKIELSSVEHIQGLASKIREQIRWHKNEDDYTEFALGMKGLTNPDFDQIEALADALTDGLSVEVDAGRRILIILEEDIAKALGQAIKRRVRNKCKIVCIDGIRVEEGDYVDIGKPLSGGQILPVIVKTLAF